MCINVGTIISEYERAEATDIFKAGYTAHKQKHTTTQVTILYMYTQCCSISFAQQLDYLQLCPTFLKIGLYLAQKVLQQITSE